MARTKTGPAAEQESTPEQPPHESALQHLEDDAEDVAAHAADGALSATEKLIVPHGAPPWLADILKGLHERLARLEHHA